MIAKTGWFVRRKYMGWGFFPRTWQAWVYVLVTVGLVVLLQSLPLPESIKMVATLILLGAFMFDIFASFRQDERETLHEAIAERNAMWTMVTVLAAGVVYQALQSAMLKRMEVDPVILIAIGAALIVKAATNVYLDRKD